MNLDLKEVRGQGNVLWKELETFDIIVDFSNLYIRDKRDIEEFFVHAKYNGGTKSAQIMLGSNYKQIKLPDIPCGQSIYVYFSIKTNAERIIELRMYYYDERERKNKEIFYRMGCSSYRLKESYETAITYGHNSNVPITIKIE